MRANCIRLVVPLHPAPLIHFLLTITVTSQGLNEFLSTPVKHHYACFMLWKAIYLIQLGMFSANLFSVVSTGNRELKVEIRGVFQMDGPRCCCQQCPLPPAGFNISLSSFFFLFSVCSRYECPWLKSLECGRVPPLPAPRHCNINIQVNVVTH